jgi:S1-C subfamily serine protease
MTLEIILILLFIILLFWIYSKSSKPSPNESIVLSKKKHISEPETRSIKTSDVQYPKINSQDIESCKVSTQLGCKLIEGSKIYTDIKEGVVMLSVNQSWQGTGFFVSPDGYIVTAAHVISEPKDENDEKGAIIPAKEIYALVAPNYDVYKCRVVGIDGTGDIGVLKIDMDDPFNRNNKPIKVRRSLPLHSIQCNLDYMSCLSRKLWISYRKRKWRGHRTSDICILCQ